MLQNEQGANLTPAFVSFTEDGRILIGDPAKSQARGLNDARVLPPASGARERHPVLYHHFSSLPTHRARHTSRGFVPRGDFRVIDALHGATPPPGGLAHR